MAVIPKLFIFAAQIQTILVIINLLNTQKMKKVLLLSLSLALGFSAFAQQRVAKNDIRSSVMSAKKVAAVGNEKINPATDFAPQTAKSVVVNRFEDYEDGETMVTTYDLQSNSWCSNRMYQLPNGSVGVTATFSHEPNQTASDRGTGYNFYKDGVWQDMPEQRVESMRTGWPTIAQWKENGEILISHAPMRCWTREIAGEGEWVYRGELPISPEGYPYSDDASWPRVATSGANHEIIHVIGDIQHSISSDEVVHHQVYLRSEDAENWTISYSPLVQDGEETGHYTADSYNITANGHNVAIVYGDDLQGHVVMYKSTDDGETWTRYVVWENPYYGYDWETDPESIMTDTMFGPANLAVAIDNGGTVHVALTAYEYIHTELSNQYTTWSGRTIDGIYHWKDTDGPIADTEHPEYIGTIYEEHFAHANPHHAMRLWWPIPDEPGYVRMHYDSTKWIGYIPLYQGYEYDHEKFYHENDYFYKFRSGQSGMPALSIDPFGNIACAYSAPCVRRLNDNGDKYYRSIYVSYYNVDNGYWVPVWDDLTDEEYNFMFLYSENLFTIGADNTCNPGEFWIGFQSDDEIGLYWGSNATQGSATDNTIHVFKIIADPELVSVPENNEALDVVYSIYPNPATDYVVVKSSQDVEANISIVNLVGQTVMQFNKSLKMGENTIGIDLKSGIYFCTISANGFNKTIKFVVK